MFFCYREKTAFFPHFSLEWVKRLCIRYVIVSPLQDFEKKCKNTKKLPPAVKIRCKNQKAPAALAPLPLRQEKTEKQPYLKQTK